MMEDSNVAIRLKGFIDSSGLTNSQFSDRCGIPRPSLSQILSGRNKKISDVIVRQIHQAFPDLSIVWLLFGEGNMINANSENSINSDNDSTDSENSILSEGVDSQAGDSAAALENEIAELFADFGDPDSAQLFTSSGRVDDANGNNEQNNSLQNPATLNKEPNLQQNQNVRGLKEAVEALKNAKKQIVDYEDKIADLQSQIDKLRQNPRKVTHITVYYDDSTFENFYTAPLK